MSQSLSSDVDVALTAVNAEAYEFEDEWNHKTSHHVDERDELEGILGVHEQE